jgi:hypothetical protein
VRRRQLEGPMRTRDLRRKTASAAPIVTRSALSHDSGILATAAHCRVGSPSPPARGSTRIWREGRDLQSVLALVEAPNWTG